MGHINLSGETVAELAERFVALSKLLPEQSFPEVAEMATKLAERV